MKVFDFSAGVRGKLLGEIRVPTSGHGMPVIDGCFIDFPDSHKAAFGRDSELTLMSACSHTSYKSETIISTAEYKPETYGVDAIVFCTGQWKAGECPAVWDWHCIGTDEFIQKNWDKWSKRKTK